jgi:hypothetical protein
MAFLLAVMVALLTVFASCGGDDSSDGRSLDLADAPALFEEDVRRSFEGSYFVAYDLRIEMEGETHNCTVKWWKDGIERQRFEMCAPLIYGDDWDAEPWRVLMFGDRDQILVCSSRLPLDPAGEFDSDGPGACHEDSTGIGDLAGNAVYFLEFPLEYPDELPAGFFDSLDEIQFEKAWVEQIAGHEARCYVISATFDDEESRRQECFAGNGAPVARSGDSFFEYELRATEIGLVTGADFALPFEYVDAAID